MSKRSRSMKTRPPPKAVHLKFTLRLVDPQIATIFVAHVIAFQVSTTRNSTGMYYVGTDAEYHNIFIFFTHPY